MADDEDDPLSPKVSSGFRQDKKKRKKRVNLGYFDKKPRQKKNKIAPPPSPQPEEEVSPANKYSRRRGL
jgi:hypothetical protein